MSDKCGMCGDPHCDTPVKCRIGLIRSGIHVMKWNLKADLWGWFFGCGCRLSREHPSWAFNNMMIEQKPKVWAAAMFAEINK